MKAFMDDQPTGRPVAGHGGAIGTTDPQSLAGQVPASGAPVHVFSSYYGTVWNGSVLSFRPGMAYQLDPALLTYLLAASAPMVAV